MLKNLLDTLASVQTGLIAALDANDLDGITRNTDALEALTGELRAQGALRTDSVVRAQLDALVRSNTAAAQRIRVLRDQNEQRLALLRGQTDGAVYAPAASRPAMMAG